MYLHVHVCIYIYDVYTLFLLPAMKSVTTFYLLFLSPRDAPCTQGRSPAHGFWMSRAAACCRTCASFSYPFLCRQVIFFCEEGRSPYEMRLLRPMPTIFHGASQDEESTRWASCTRPCRSKSTAATQVLELPLSLSLSLSLSFSMAWLARFLASTPKPGAPRRSEV